MIASWMLYATVVGCLLSASALSLERALAAVGRSRRWAWAGAMIASVALPLAGILGLGASGGGMNVLPVGAGNALRGALAPLVAAESVGAPAWFGLPAVDSILLVAWLAASGVLGLLHLRSHRTLIRARAGWTRATADALDSGDSPHLRRGDVPVLLTEALGPAVVGVRRGEILLPRWCLELPPEERALVVAHEVEHVRAGDGWLLAAARLALVGVPWLLPLWWQMHRLRLAVEIDCDGRVLRRGADPSLYGRLLLEVGRRRGPPHARHAVAALAEPVSNLERRIRTMLESKPRHWMRAALAASAALGLVAVACESPTPAGDGDGGAQAEGIPSTAPDGAAIRDEGAEGEPTAPARYESDGTETGVPTEPAYVPRDEEPRLLNGEDLSAALQERASPDGPDGRVNVMMFIDEQGNVTETRIHESSGHEELDRAAREVVKLARFEPAKRGNEDIGVWVIQAVEFRTE